MSTLIIRMPPHAAADEVQHWVDLPCAYTRADGRLISGIEPLSELAGEISDARRLVLMIAASDVTVLRIRVPPLSAAQLQRALPNLLEDRLLSDPDECVFVPSPVEDGMCTVAVMQRGWLELIARTVAGYGGSAVVAVPTQLCLAAEPDAAAVAISADERDIALRLSPDEGFGLHLAAGSAKSATHATQVLESIIAMLPTARIRLYVPGYRLDAYRDALSAFGVRSEEAAAQAARIELREDSWGHWIKGTGRVQMNLLADAPNAASARHSDWRSRRMIAVLLFVFMLVNIAGLNIEWWQMRREAAQLRAEMMQTYRKAFPHDTVVIDPLLQMRRHVASGGPAGELTPDSFLALLARFGSVWSAETGSPPAPAIAHLSYGERSLGIGLHAGNEATMEKLQPALRAQGLAVSQNGQDMWQIRNAP
ncbi:MAG TPA: type II secretion system protein GspL [Oxalicibacterium sp.]|nr:type II secretion system protein GspL [Oxalicibacterium sp.]